MKKALVILLAVAMMFCFSATAFAANFNDTADCSKEAQNAINKVAALGIVAGYDDGGYHPGDSITRAEFAKMADVTAGLEDAARDLQDVQSQFKDVKVSVWYTGWINLASAQGYVVGYEDNTYRPNNTISYAEVVTVAMRLLGYNANLTGPWPINYINQATKLGVLDDVENFSANAPATRSDVAIILSAALDENMVKWVSDDNEFVEKTKKVTDENGEAKDVTYNLLEDSFDGKTVSGTVDEVNVTDEENFEYQVGVGDNNFDADVDTAVAGSEIYLLKDREVTVIHDEDNYANYIQVDDEIIEVKEAEITKAETADTKGKVKLDGKTYTMAAGADENVAEFDSDTDDFNVTGYALINSDDEVVVADVDGNIGCYLYGDILLVTEVDTDDEDDYTVSVVNYGNIAEDIDANADEAIFIKNGVRVAATDIKAGDLLVVGWSENMYGVVANPSVKGVVTDYDTTDMVEIANKEYVRDQYTFALDSDYEDATLNWKDLYDNEDEVAVYVGYDNVIWYVINDNDTVTDNYGILLGLKGSTDPFNNNDFDVEYATVFTKDGTVKDIAVKDNVTLTINETQVSLDQALKDIGKGNAFTYALNKDGEIKSVALVTGEGYIAATKNGDGLYAFEVVDNKTVKVNGVKRNIASDAVIFNVEDDYEVSLLTKDEVLADDNIIAAPLEDDADVNYLVVKLNDKNQIEFMAVTNFGGESTVDYAIVERITANNVKFYNDNTTYALAEDAEINAAVDQLVTYKMSGNEVTKVTAVDTEGKGFAEGVVDTYDNGMITFVKEQQQQQPVTADVADDCVFVKFEDGKYTYTTAAKAIKADNNLTYKLNGDDEAEIIIWVAE